MNPNYKERQEAEAIKLIYYVPHSKKPKLWEKSYLLTQIKTQWKNMFIDIHRCSSKY